jgi:hypothetical protein
MIYFYIVFKYWEKKIKNRRYVLLDPISYAFHILSMMVLFNVLGIIWLIEIVYKTKLLTLLGPYAFVLLLLIVVVLYFKNHKYYYDKINALDEEFLENPDRLGKYEFILQNHLIFSVVFLCFLAILNHYK